MQGERQVIAHLNAQLENELTAIDPVLPACAHAAPPGLRAPGRRSTTSRHRRDEARRQARRAHSRFSAGCPTCRTSASSYIGENVPEMLRAELGLECSVAGRREDGALPTVSSCATTSRARSSKTSSRTSSEHMRLDRDAARSCIDDVGAAELPAVADGRGELAGELRRTQAERARAPQARRRATAASTSVRAGQRRHVAVAHVGRRALVAADLGVERRRAVERRLRHDAAASSITAVAPVLVARSIGRAGFRARACARSAGAAAAASESSNHARLETIEQDRRRAFGHARRMISAPNRSS